MANYVFRGLDIYTQQLSTAEDNIGDEAKTRTEELAKRGKEILTEIQNRSKQENGRIVGGPAVISGKMISSIDYKQKYNSRGRTQFEWGFMDSPPDWVRFKERGTRTGMIPMHGLVQTNQRLNAEFDNVFDNSFWSDIGLWR